MTPPLPRRQAADKPPDYRRARGAVPWKAGMEKPEDVISRSRGHCSTSETIANLLLIGCLGLLVLAAVCVVIGAILI